MYACVRVPEPLDLQTVVSGHVDAELNLGPLEKQAVPLSDESSLHPIVVVGLFACLLLSVFF